MTSLFREKTWKSLRILAQLVPQAGLTSAQTDAVIPPGTPVSSRSRSLKAEFRRRTTFHSCTPTSGQVSHTVWHTFAILRIKSRQTPLFEPGSATFYRIGYRFCARPILPMTYRSIRRPGGPTHPPSRGTEGVCPLGGGRDVSIRRTASCSGERSSLLLQKRKSDAYERTDPGD